jgi:asparagine synthase (glutamine-hydrolysing)
MRLRGPDDHGYERFVQSGGAVVLGHTRLSVIDLSHAGHQPMHTPNGRFSIVFNGEIYNYLELRKELKNQGVAFKTNSDTEVLLAAWAQWGANSLKRLTGMFAFVVFDRELATLTCVRDGFGIKPLFITQEGPSFAFASELSALVELKQNKAELDWQSSYNYLVHGDYDSGSGTFFSGVTQLMPGHEVTLDLRSGTLLKPTRWWSPVVTKSNISFKDATAQLREMFLSNVGLHLRSDVSLGAALSGGLDSSAVVCAMRHIEPDLPIKTFSYIAQGSPLSEEVWVDLVNTATRATAHKILVEPQEMLADLDDMIRAQGEPFGGTSIYAQYRVFKAARDEGVTVTLDGQGADEMLAGYSGYPGQRLHSLLDDGEWAQATSFLNNWAAWPGRSRMAGLKRLLGELASGSTVYDYMRRWNGEEDEPKWLDLDALRDGNVRTGFLPRNQNKSDSGRRVAAALREALTANGLPSLLRHADRNSMRFSVESRVPFLTTGIAEFLLTLPEEYLISRQGETKHVFRAAMRSIVPDEILDRRDKIGFATPEADWLKLLLPKMREWLQEDLKLPFIKHQTLLNSFEESVNSARQKPAQVWRWINFYRWYAQSFY